MIVKPDISVIICTRDRPERLRACLESLNTSEPKPFEVLVMDQSRNGSTRHMVEEFASASTLDVHYTKLDSVGHTRSRNAGVKASRGEIIAFTDDDCTVDADWIGVLAKEFADTSVDCVCGGTRPADHGERPRQAWLSTLYPLSRRRVTRLMNPVMAGRGNNMAFRKSSLLGLGGFNEQIGVGTHLYAGDDLDLFCRLLDVSGVMIQSSEAMVSHAQPDDLSSVLVKKRAYAISSSAVLAIRARQGDPIAAFLLLGKIGYEVFYLIGGGLLCFDKLRIRIGWHSVIGSLSGLKHLRNRELCNEIRRLSGIARQNHAPSDEVKALGTFPTANSARKQR